MTCIELDEANRLGELGLHNKSHIIARTDMEAVDAAADGFEVLQALGVAYGKSGM